MKKWRSKHNGYFCNMSGSSQFIRTSFSSWHSLSYSLHIVQHLQHTARAPHIKWFHALRLMQSTGRAHAVLWTRLHEKRYDIAPSKSTLWSVKGQLRFQVLVWSHLHFLLEPRLHYQSCPTYIARWCNDLKRKGERTQHNTEINQFGLECHLGPELI